jgi:flagellar motor switch protein FliG
MIDDIHTLTGRQKTAILLVALGPETASKMLRKMNEEEVEKITFEIADLDIVSPEVRNQVVEEFYNLALTREYISKGGIEYAKSILEGSFDAGKVGEMVRRVQGAIEKRDFHTLKNIDAAQLVNFIQKEHPQVIAVILAHLESRQAAEVFSKMREELQGEVAFRIATMEKSSPDLIKDIEEILEEKTATLLKQDTRVRGGPESLVQILIDADRSTERRIVDYLEDEDPELATKVKNMMFVFEDIMLIDDRSIQRILKEVDTKELAIALKGATDDVREKIFSNMSTRAATTLKEDLEILGPMKVSIVEGAQQKVVSVIRRLEEEGEIVIIGRGGKKDEVIL